MKVALPEVGRHGRLELTFGCRRGRTTIEDAYCEVPFKFTHLLESETWRIAHLILMQCTAGLFGGDVAELRIDVQAGARVLITPQSALKIHPSADKLAVLRTRIRVKDGGEAHIYNEPIIPFAGSRLHQTTSIEIEPGSRLFFWDSIMAGRIGRGEAWQFAELWSETQLCLTTGLNRRILYLDRFSLTPSRCSPAGPWMMGDAVYLGAGLCFGAEEGCADRLHGLLPKAGVDSPEPGLAIVRTVADRGPEFHQARTVFMEENLAQGFSPALSARL
jgi:urease accessory protein